jgi:hypothetical protein
MGRGKANPGIMKDTFNLYLVTEIPIRFKETAFGQAGWLKHVILDIWETEIGNKMIQGK